MTRMISLMVASMVLAACGQSPAPEDTATGVADASTAVPATASTTGDPCSLVDDPAEMFGKPVTAAVNTMPNGSKTCEWKADDGSICGSVTVFGAGWFEVPSLAAGYAGMAKSVGVFGQAQPLSGVGEEAVAVDGGMFGAQVALRTNKAIANVAAACAGKGAPNFAQVEKLARTVAAKL